MGKSRKIRTEFRKGQQSRVRRSDFTRDVLSGEEGVDDLAKGERVSGKGNLTRKRTIVGADDLEETSGVAVIPSVEDRSTQMGRVLSVHGLQASILGTDGNTYQCGVRRVLKSLSTEQRNVVATGDLVRVRIASGREGLIERVEPRYGVLRRTSKGRQHVMVTNVDQVLIVASVAQPNLKPNLIDRFLVTAEHEGIHSIVCFNKIDLIDPAEIMPLASGYAQMGYDIVFASAAKGIGIDFLRKKMRGKASVVAGQSGVGKSSLLNAIEPGFSLATKTVSGQNEKGRHTTTSAQLLPLSFGGFVVDTPGIRQFQLWDVVPEEVAGFMRDIRPWVNACRFPNCSHRHEVDCGVKAAVADGFLDTRRYESYIGLYEGQSE